MKTNFAVAAGALLVSSLSSSAFAGEYYTYNYNQSVNGVYVISVEAVNSTFDKLVCTQTDLGSCVQTEIQKTPALFLRLNANMPSCGNGFTLGGSVRAVFQQNGGVGHVEMVWLLDRFNEGLGVHDWKNVEGYFGDPESSNVTLVVNTRCDRN